MARHQGGGASYMTESVTDDSSFLSVYSHVFRNNIILYHRNPLVCHAETQKTLARDPEVIKQTPENSKDTEAGSHCLPDNAVIPA